jgi:2-polyprenyl-6-methoxyphenol hydroxylase-like FAD-dependent oxidoreductase
MDIDVLIVGAGPTGLILACWLARLGIRPLVIDQKEGLTAETRAIGVQARTLET